MLPVKPLISKKSLIQTTTSRDNLPSQIKLHRQSFHLFPHHLKHHSFSEITVLQSSLMVHTVFTHTQREREWNFWQLLLHQWFPNCLSEGHMCPNFWSVTDNATYCPKSLGDIGRGWNEGWKEKYQRQQPLSRPPSAIAGSLGIAPAQLLVQV